jgi:hypothetical protein
MIKLAIFDESRVLYRCINEIGEEAKRKLLKGLAYQGKVIAKEAHERWLVNVGPAKRLNGWMRVVTGTRVEEAKHN